MQLFLVILILLWMSSLLLVGLFRRICPKQNYDYVKMGGAIKKYWPSADRAKKRTSIRNNSRPLIDAYVYNEQEPLRDEVFKCLDNRPSVLLARSIGECIITKMKQIR